MKFDENIRFMQLVEDLKIRGKVADYVQLANMLGTNKSGINDIKNCRKKISVELLQRMKSSYPDISFDWIIMGVGDMYTDNGQVESVPRQEDPTSTYKFLEEMIREKDKIIMGLSEKIGRLKEMLGKQEEKYAESSFSSLENAVENAL